MKKAVTTLVALMAVGLFAGHANASLLARESFEGGYDTNSTLNGQAALGDGFTGSWVNNGTGWQAGTPGALPLTYTDHQDTADTRIFGAAGWTYSYVSLDVAGAFSAYSSDNTYVNQGTVWVSVMLRQSGGAGNNGFSFGLMPNAPANQNGLLWDGNDIILGNSNGDDAIELHVNQSPGGGSTITNGLGQALEYSTDSYSTKLIVLKIEFTAGTDTITAYAQGTVGTDPATWPYQRSVTADFGGFRALAWMATNATGRDNTGSDEVRFGSSYSDVLGPVGGGPVATPGTLIYGK